MSGGLRSLRSGMIARGHGLQRAIRSPFSRSLTIDLHMSTGIGTGADTYQASMYLMIPGYSTYRVTSSL